MSGEGNVFSNPAIREAFPSAEAKQAAREAAGENVAPPNPSDLDKSPETGGLGNPSLRAWQRGGDDQFNFDGRPAANPIWDKDTGRIIMEGATIVTQSPEANRVQAALLRPSQLARADLKGLDFSQRQISDTACLDGADASGCKFDKGGISGSAAGATFEGSSMVEADCRKLRAPRATFRNVVATAARFSGELRETTWDGAVLDNARFEYPCDLRGSRILETAKSLKGCSFAPGVKLEDTSFLDRKYR